ncbi:P-loop containing nucleoside triphosphate hydrolase protein [Leptodontidium sp. 2 PMI_412]|nr:P-loop containing nucleoside triphosphate hydrolase protein [Leptodontidium sp. 2 PMI_412]
MRLLQYNNDGDFSLTEFFESGIPNYAILSHRWGAEEVTFKDLTEGTSKGKAGYRKIQFCGEQARRDGLQYFWVDTCCIDKSNAVELQEAINSMFRWYRDATKGGTTGNKVSLERQICEIIGITVKALRGCPLSDFSVAERMSWAANRETYRQEDMAYSLLGIFDVNMPLIYSEGKDKALQRLREEIDKASKGFKREDFSVAFSLSDVSDVEHFVARKTELLEMHNSLNGDGSRRVVVLHGLGGIGKTQLSAAYAKRHKDSYSGIFWLNIKDEDSLKQSFAKVAKQISREHSSASRLNNVDTKENLDGVVDVVKAWLSLPGNTRWLLIYDNYDNPKFPGNMDPAAVDIQKFLPESYQGSIVITTRSSQVRFGHSIQIRKLRDMRDSIEILSNASRREGLRIDPDAIQLAKELDGLPLALATAGAYLDQVAISLSDYLRRYKESWVQLQESSPEPSSMQGKEKACGPEHTSTLDAVNNLGSFYKSQSKLVEAEQMYQRALQGFEKAWGPEHTLTLDTVNNLGLLYAHQGKLVEAEQMHQRALQGFEKAWGPEHTSTLAPVYNLGILSTHQGKLVEAEQMYQRALQGYEKALGADNIITYIPALNAIWGLGSLFELQADITEARTMYSKALIGYEKVVGPDHPRSQSLRDKLHALDTVMENRALVEVEDSVNNPQGGPSHLGAEETTSKSKRNKLFRKLGFK